MKKKKKKKKKNKYIKNRKKRKKQKHKKAIICHIIAVNNITIFSFLIIWVFFISFSIFHLRIFILRLRVSLLTEDTYYDSIFPNIHKLL